MEGEKDIESLPEDDSWVFESLVNFLHGPLWKLPVSGFIEEKSVVFDPESYNETLSKEREAEFKRIHEEYKILVDFMLGSFMEDLEVTPEQVEEACRSRNSSDQGQQDSQLTKAALQQLSAAEDMDTFRRLMTRKNIDLQLQSLELLVAKYGELSPALKTFTAEDESGSEVDDDFLALVLRYTQKAAALDLEEQNLHHPMHKHHESGGTQYTEQATSQIKAYEDVDSESVNLKVEDKKEGVVEAVVEPLPASTHSPNVDPEVDLIQKTVEEIKLTAPVQSEMLVSIKKALEDTNPVQGNFMNMSLAEVTGQLPCPAVSEDDIERRREYMRSQRDKLVALKKKERARLVSDSMTGSQFSRPKSSKAAAIALSKNMPKTTPNEKSLAARKALADRLKQELQSK